MSSEFSQVGISGLDILIDLLHKCIELILDLVPLGLRSVEFFVDSIGAFPRHHGHLTILLLSHCFVRTHLLIFFERVDPQDAVRLCPLLTL